VETAAISMSQHLQIRPQIVPPLARTVIVQENTLPLPHFTASPHKPASPHLPASTAVSLARQPPRALVRSSCVCSSAVSSASTRLCAPSSTSEARALAVVAKAQTAPSEDSHAAATCRASTVGSPGVFAPGCVHPWTTSHYPSQRGAPRREQYGVSGAAAYDATGWHPNRGGAGFTAHACQPSAPPKGSRACDGKERVGTSSNATRLQGV